MLPLKSHLLNDSALIWAAKVRTFSVITKSFRHFFDAMTADLSPDPSPVPRHFLDQTISSSYGWRIVDTFPDDVLAKPAKQIRKKSQSKYTYPL